VVKVNINAELRRAHVEALRAGLDVRGDDIRSLQRAAIDAMARVAHDRIRLLAPGSAEAHSSSA
jgi:fructose-bisphosphate aldolase class II/tagatose 1,6-diphosphate aldolase GatY/KbaY